jgi:DNA-directed RNA polymerase specialized sigma24 family protein
MSRKSAQKAVNPQQPDQIELLAEIKRLAELLVGLTLQIAKNDKSQSDAIYMLNSIGCGQSEIARLLGTDRHTVKTALYRLKKTKRNRRAQ